ncbi:MAG TPA: hypothetical protein VEQ85_09545 [Lacipirellulaceae bacterium]|nr:hypothetical protein [Lacipirellulaceae bacterium]
MRYSSLLLVLVALPGAWGLAGARADIFELRDGGRITGEAVERTESAYRIRTADGAEATLDRSQLQRVVPQDAKLQEYQRRSRAAADTADAHRALVAWCREQGLAQEAEHHLRRVVDLDPADEDARRSLGFQRVGDRWLDRDDVMTLRGLVYFDGKWRTPQDIAIRQRDGAVGEGEANWFAKVRLWRGWLDNRRDARVHEAQAAFASIADPQAAPALVKLLDGEEDEWAFDILLAAIGRLDDPLAVQTLVEYSLEYDHADKRRAAEVRATCIDFLVAGARPVSILPYVQALKSKDNIVVNRAGDALKQIGNPAAISPLIDALVTTHKYLVQEGNPGQMSAGFDPSGSGGGGLSMGGNGPKYVDEDRENIRVRDALVKLSGGQNFDFDELAWRHWYVDLLMRQHANARRDE